MQKERFNFLVSNYRSLDQQETAELRNEQDHYGYCQVLHNLIARGDQDNQSTDKDHSLNIAAVYSTDRSVLKQIMTDPRAPRVSNQPISEVVTVPIVEVVKAIELKPEPLKVEEPKQAKAETVATTLTPLQNFDVDAALSRFVAELGPMHEKKLEFEKAIDELNKNLNLKSSLPSESANPETAPPKPKRGRPAKAKSATEPPAQSTEQLIKDITSSKKKVAPTSAKQKEQEEIIDEFIKSAPSISKPTAAKPQEDLTEATEPYNENVVSETLAMILIKQGKKDKAVEVLRKLIWKFPQKKAYFAAQIEDLTK